MREIVFRGKNYKGEWLYGSLQQWYDTFGGDIKSQIHPVELEPTQQGGRVDSTTIGQFTGLVDRNGKRIFEGDIIKITDHTIEETFESCGELVTMLMTRTYEVFWNTTKWSIKLIEPMLGVDPPIFDLLTKNVTYEIIGNIHEEKA